MKNKTDRSKPLSSAEARLIELLREQPEMMERFQSIVALSNAAEGPLKTADEIEELLIEEVRKLGNATMREWASKAQERVTSELKAQDPTVRSRKKKR
jgi:hypothetical protein